MSDDTTQPFANTICSICHEHLKPIVENLQAISICGHVFHELCIQQWFEYCSKGKKKCPICKQTCSAANVSRLYFQSLSDSNDPNLSQKLQTHKEDPEELKLEVRRLEGKINVLNLALECRDNDDDDDEDESEEEEEHDEEEEEPQQQLQQQYQLPPQNFYGEFTAFRDETRAYFNSMFDGFRYLFTNLHAMHPDYFGNPPYPFGAPGDTRRRGHDGAGLSATRQDDDQD